MSTAAIIGLSAIGQDVIAACNSSLNLFKLGALLRAG
jgi:hypothetical protein